LNDPVLWLFICAAVVIVARGIASATLPDSRDDEPCDDRGFPLYDE
jgi:hypothetical protein